MSDIYSKLSSLEGKRILGINPPVHDFAYYDLWAKPVGLLYLLQYLRDSGNSIDLIDSVYESAEKKLTWGRLKPRRMEIEKPSAYRNIPRRYHHFGLDEEQLVDRIKNIAAPDVILVTSTMTYWYPGVHWCIEIVKKVFPEVPLILGGIYARLCPEHARGSGADFIQTEHIAVTAPYPAMDLYDSPGYGIIETSWGCPMGCDYCASKILCPSFRQRSVDEVALEIDFQVKTCGVENFAFYDDALLVNRKDHFYRICDMIDEKFENLRFHTPNGLHVGMIDEECAARLYSIGSRTIRLSLESVDPDIQEKSSSKVSEVQFDKAVKNLLDAGYSHGDIETYVLVGLPGQSIQGIMDTIDFAKGLGARVKTAQFSPIPGTALFDQALRKVPELAEEPLLQNNTVYSTWVSGNMTPEELQMLKDYARS